MQLKYLDLDGLTSFYNQFTSKVTELVTDEVGEAGSALETSLQGWVNAKLGAASGIATLDANQKLTASQLPDITFPDYTNIYVALGATNQTIQGNKTFSGTTTFGSSLTISNAGITKTGSGTVNIGSSSAPINNIYATTFTGSLSGNATTATTATKLGTADVGNNMTPMYLADGVPTAMPYTIQKSVPADAIFTDTVYTLTTANDTTLGGIKTGFATTGKRYGIKVDSNGNAYVDVDWTDTNTTYTLASFGITVTSTEINNYNIYVVLENLFSREVFSSIGIVPIGKDEIGNMSFSDEEIERIGRFFNYAKANASFLIDDADLEDSQAFENMLNEGLDSQILSVSIINIIDNSLQDYFSSVGINITLQEMRNSLYKEDADNISHILELKDKFSFTSSDPLKDLDTQSLNVILSELSSTNLINYILIEGNTSTDINTNMTTIIDKFLKHYDIYNRIGALDHFFESERCLFNRQRYELINLDGYNHQFTYCTYGEISGLTSFLSYLQGLDLDEVLSGIILADFISDCDDYLLQSKFASYFGITIYQRALDVISVDPNVADFVDHFDFYSLISNLPTTDRSDLEVMDLLFYEIITNNLSSLLAGENYDLDAFETFYNALTASNIAYIYNDTYSFTPYEFLLYKVFSNSDVLAYLTDSLDESIQYKVFDSLVREIREEDRDDILEFIIFMNNRDISSLSDEEKDNVLDIIHNIPFFINLYNNL